MNDNLPSSIIINEEQYPLSYKIIFFIHNFLMFFIVHIFRPPINFIHIHHNSPHHFLFNELHNLLL